MSNETMTDARALEVLERRIAKRHEDCRTRKALEHAAARLRGEAAQPYYQPLLKPEDAPGGLPDEAQGEQQAVAWIDLGQHGMLSHAVLRGVSLRATRHKQVQGCTFIGKVGNELRMNPQCVNVARPQPIADDKQPVAVAGDAVRALVADIAQQKPEKPDHWNSCGQCERNAELAQEVLETLSAAPAAPTPVSTHERVSGAGRLKVSPSEAAHLLSQNGVLESAKKHMRFPDKPAPVMEFSLGEAVALLQSFGGTNCSMSVQEWDAIPRKGDEYPARAGKHAWSTSYPEEGASWLGEHDTDTEAFEGWDAKAPESAPAPVVPEGWRLVPVEPATRQIAAMGPAIRACFELDGVRGNVRDVYAAMLAAAPQPAAQEAGNHG